MPPFGPLVYWCFDHPRSCYVCLWVRRQYHTMMGINSTFREKSFLRTWLPSLSRRKRPLDGWFYHEGLTGGELTALATEGVVLRKEGNPMDMLLKVVMGGWIPEGKRTQWLAMGTAVVAMLSSLMGWAAGDMDMTNLLKSLQENWVAFVAAYGLFFVGEKVDRKEGK